MFNMSYGRDIFWSSSFLCFNCFGFYCNLPLVAIQPPHTNTISHFRFKFWIQSVLSWYWDTGLTTQGTVLEKQYSRFFWYSWCCWRFCGHLPVNAMLIFLTWLSSLCFPCCPHWHHTFSNSFPFSFLTFNCGRYFWHFCLSLFPSQWRYSFSLSLRPRALMSLHCTEPLCTVLYLLSSYFYCTEALCTVLHLLSSHFYCTGVLFTISLHWIALKYPVCTAFLSTLQHTELVCTEMLWAWALVTTTTL